MCFAGVHEVLINVTCETVIDPVTGLVAVMETMYDPGWS